MMTTFRIHCGAVLLFWACLGSCTAPKGKILLAGGGDLGPEIMNRFQLEVLANYGLDANITIKLEREFGSLEQVEAEPEGELAKAFGKEVASKVKALSVVLIPTAIEGIHSPEEATSSFFRKMGIRTVILHTRNRSEADTDRFVEPLRQARAVWIAGGPRNC